MPPTTFTDLSFSLLLKQFLIGSTTNIDSSFSRWKCQTVYEVTVANYSQKGVPDTWACACGKELKQKTGTGGSNLHTYLKVQHDLEKKT